MSSIIMRFREGMLAVAVGAGAGLAGSFLVARHMWQRTGEACDGIDACTNAMRAERGLRPRLETVSDLGDVERQRGERLRAHASVAKCVCVCVMFFMCVFSSLLLSVCVFVCGSPLPLSLCTDVYPHTRHMSTWCLLSLSICWCGVTGTYARAERLRGALAARVCGAVECAGGGVLQDAQMLTLTWEASRAQNTVEPT